MILIDELRDYNGPMPGKWCHMMSDLGGAEGLAELHAVAARLGLKPEWFQNENPRHPHYDLRPSRRRQAAELAQAGAAVEFVDSITLVRRIAGKYPKLITDAELWAWSRDRGVRPVEMPGVELMIRGARIVTVQAQGGGWIGRGADLRLATLDLMLREQAASKDGDSQPRAFYCKQ